MNYKHLQYFMHVAKSGSVMRASEQLHLTPQTISGQIQLLEAALGKSLFIKRGRGLALTDAGRHVLGYAEQIFSLGAELEAAVNKSAQREQTLEFRIGVSDAIPKSIAFRLIEPATSIDGPLRVVCREWKIGSLLAELALHRLDLVVSDAPTPTDVRVRAFNHRLGASGLSFFAAPALHRTLRGAFPLCLNGAAMLMPGEDSALDSKLRAWFQARALRPTVTGVFDDDALMKEFGRHGSGVFAAPTVLAHEITRSYKVKLLGSTDEIQVEYFAISIERRITHPCVVAMTQAARSDLFPGSARRSKRL